MRLPSYFAFSFCVTQLVSLAIGFCDKHRALVKTCRSKIDRTGPLQVPRNKADQRDRIILPFRHMRNRKD
uniref:Putative secreted protein n=1 Tax=Rhipicephalus microplus TaxID=6941 RepID=A0A6M2DBP9_RHIMP